jgi:UDP-N-acetylmuramyl pentapeptide phosphotransferase/UDP-N-acetylglucosamine-1-phosphate transferase
MLWNNDISVIFSFFLAFIIVFFSVPSIVSISNAKGLFDKPSTRKSHIHNTPNLGGIATFAGIIISLSLFSNAGINRELVLLFSSMTILFFIGVKDDILVIAPNKKLMGQIISSLIIVMLGNVRFTSLHGFLGYDNMPYIASVLLSVFVMVVIINAFNLIDGIDGLASGLGILIAGTFGTWFYLTGNYNYAILSASVIGAYLAFFSFNVFGSKNKIFMGDTGSLVLGLIISIMVIRFNEGNITNSGPYFVQSAPAVSFGILIVPMFDTLRVFLIRIIRRQSPFHADKNHLHHRLLLLGFNHFESTMIITTFNAAFIFIVLTFKEIGVLKLMALNIIIASVLMLVIEFFIKRNYNAKPSLSTINQFENRSAKSA